jgi:3-oxoacyl-[acyl-carrier-protein] synthase-3
MDGRAVFSQAVRAMSEACESVLAECGLTIADIDWVLPHQANLRIIDAIVKRLGLSRDKVLVNLDRYGNTSSASIPITLDEAVRDGRIRDGSTILSCGMGAGLVWGAALFRW